MDSNSTLILVNVLISFIHLFDTFIQRIKKSTCFGNILEMKDSVDLNKNKKNIDNDKDIDLTKKIQDILMNNIKKDDKIINNDIKIEIDKL